VVVIHQGTADGLNPTGNAAGTPWTGPILGIADQLQDTTVDAMIVGHTHRVSNLMRGKILVTEGVNAGATYSVLQLMVQGGDVTWAGGATRVAVDEAFVAGLLDFHVQNALLIFLLVPVHSLRLARGLVRQWLHGLQ
jgi:hypothetical protein